MSKGQSSKMHLISNIRGEVFRCLGTRTWVFFEGSGNVLGTRRSDGSSKPGMSCGEDAAEASMRDRG